MGFWEIKIPLYIYCNREDTSYRCPWREFWLPNYAFIPSGLCLFIPSTTPSVHPSVCPPDHLSIHPSTYPTDLPFVHPSAQATNQTNDCLHALSFIHLSIHSSVHHSVICQLIILFIHLSNFLFSQLLSNQVWFLVLTSFTLEKQLFSSSPVATEQV